MHQHIVKFLKKAKGDADTFSNLLSDSKAFNECMKHADDYRFNMRILQTSVEFYFGNYEKAEPFQMNFEEASVLMKILNPPMFFVWFAEKETGTSKFAELLDEAKGKIGFHFYYDFGNNVDILLSKYWNQVTELSCIYSMLESISNLEPKKQLDKMLIWDVEFMCNLTDVLRLNVKHLEINISSFFHTNPLFLNQEEHDLLASFSASNIPKQRCTAEECSPDVKNSGKPIEKCEIDIFSDEDVGDVVRLVFSCCQNMTFLQINGWHWAWSAEKGVYLLDEVKTKKGLKKRMEWKMKVYYGLGAK